VNCKYYLFIVEAFIRIDEFFWEEYSAAIMDSSNSSSALIPVYSAFSSSSGSAVQVSSCVMEEQFDE
jgi:hypothetical protein